MRQYHDLLRLVLEHGKPRTDRTGVGTISLFGAQARFDLRENFPLLTTKKLHLKSIIHELLWFLRGDTNVRSLQRSRASRSGTNGRTKMAISAASTARNGPTGAAPMARASIRSTTSSRRSRTNPDSRRLIVSAWNPAEIETMALPPCHVLFQFYVREGELSCQLYQRSADLFLGVPFNIASYALLTMMVAQVCDLEPGEFIHTFGDLHLYQNHLEQAREQLSRECRPLPRMRLNPAIKNIHDFRFEDFTLGELRSASRDQSADRGVIWSDAVFSGVGLLNVETLRSSGDCSAGPVCEERVKVSTCSPPVSDHAGLHSETILAMAEFARSA